MKERPILFSGAMVRAILDVRKSQTRRIVKQNITGPNPPSGFFDWHHQKTGKWIGAHGGGMEFGKTNASSLCPYGQPGDRLWVRESMRYSKEHDNLYYAADSQGIGVARYCDLQGKFPRKSIPSIHMPRWASRITLEITNVRVERVRDIKERDAIAEGASEYPLLGVNSMKTRFRYLWDSINAARGYGWEVNPWVWVIEFRRVS